MEIGLDNALTAQNKGITALSTGEVKWTESEFSSLLTEIIRQNTGNSLPIRDIKVWFTPRKFYLRVTSTTDVTTELVGHIMVQDNHLTVQLDEAGIATGATGMIMSELLLKEFEGVINRILNSPNLGVAVEIVIGSGTLTLRLAP